MGYIGTLLQAPFMSLLLNETQFKSAEFHIAVTLLSLPPRIGRAATQMSFVHLRGMSVGEYALVR